MNAALADAPADRFWPSWSAREDTELEGRRLTPHQALALYVSARAVEAVPRLKPPRPSGRVGTPRQHEELAEALYRRLVAAELHYAIEPWLPRGHFRQQIRHPAWLAHLRWGTCLDLAVTYAAMCLAEDLAPLLVVGDGHVLVALTPGRPRTLHAALAMPGCEAEAPGVLKVTAPERFAEHVRDGELMAVETTYAVQRGEGGPPTTFAEARVAGARQLEHAGAGELRIIDVAWLQEPEGKGFGIPPLDPPGSWLGIGMHLPDGLGDQELFTGQQALLRELSGARGIHVIAADPGYGKSTVARHLVAAAPFGAGWFLGASDDRVLTNSLAGAELAQRNRPAADLGDIDRAGYAGAALGRLREARHAWVVVLDNVDENPDRVLRRAPRPRAGDDQLVVITTTNIRWAEASGHAVHHLKPVTSTEVVEELRDERLEPFVAGRPLVLTAFKRLAEALDVPPSELPIDPDLQPGGEAGPQAFWCAARTQALDADDLRTARCAAFLPPDGVSVAALDALHPHGAGAARLRAVGLLEHVPGQEHGRLHRLFGAAIRSELDHDRAVRQETAMQVASTLEATENLAELGARPLVSTLLEILEECEEAVVPPARHLAVCLHAIGGVFELRNDTEQAARAYARALPHLDRSVSADRPLVADCLLGMARTANRHVDDVERLSEGLAQAEEAHRVMVEDGLAERAGRFLAMRGLLEVKLASRIGRSDEEIVAGLRRGLERIEEADRLRRADKGTPPEELSRSAFNRARPYVRLASHDRANAAEHLAEARAVYAGVRAQREKFYPHLDAHGHVAACIAGVALVDYLAAMFVAETPEQQREALRAATGDALEAARQREALAWPHEDGDVAKSYRLIAKIAMARHVLPLPAKERDGDHRKLMEEIYDELPAGGLLDGSPWLEEGGSV